MSLRKSMTCDEVLPLLGRLYDGELDAVSRASVLDHVVRCSDCTGELDAIKELGAAARNASSPEPPADAWEQIERRLNAAPAVGAATILARLRWERIVAVAALVLVAVYTGWFAHFRPANSNQSPLADPATGPTLNLAQYLDAGVPDEFAGGPEFRHTDVAAGELARQVSFRVFDRAELPGGYSRQHCMTGMMRMMGDRMGHMMGPMVGQESGSLVQTEYRRGNDRCVIFQYPAAVSPDLGRRSAELVEVNRKPVQLVQGRSGWAAAWQCHGTGVTVVGPRDRSELLRIVAHVDSQVGEEKS
jgi:hypothetical protein